VCVCVCASGYLCIYSIIWLYTRSYAVSAVRVIFCICEFVNACEVCVYVCKYINVYIRL
jgi:hypothetical protein